MNEGEVNLLCARRNELSRKDRNGMQWETHKRLVYAQVLYHKSIETSQSRFSEKMGPSKYRSLRRPAPACRIFCSLTSCAAKGRPHGLNQTL